MTFYLRHRRRTDLSTPVLSQRGSVDRDLGRLQHILHRFHWPPIGAAIFGHYGDRVGRKATLISTLLVMGISTFLIAFVPGYASVGIRGAVILTVLRTLQGIGVGGEWGGSVLIAMEWSRGHGS